MTEAASRSKLAEFKEKTRNSEFIFNFPPSLTFWKLVLDNQVKEAVISFSSFEFPLPFSD